VITEVWLSSSEATIIRRSALVQQLRVREDPMCLIIYIIIIISYELMIGIADAAHVGPTLLAQCAYGRPLYLGIV